MVFTPLPLVDNFLQNYHIGHVLAVLLIGSVVGTLPLGSRKIVAINTTLFGVLFLATPESLLGETPFMFRFVGIALLVIAPILFVTARE
ncbi:MULTISPECIES: hypothetical protein [Halobacterium]|uniref:DUF8006 domain-containing protein n=4 Tax=Halobacterium salinarum TaxID=2242 RepID=Q9HNW9_HALSA|nr:MULTISPECIES: hypothetical protein [Halobacterium]AAG20101.1 hypothetical protein VNG_1910H [Halobacterium salinarum NRC-1]MBB6089114.1 hypothetical protein [Halobacterium salinarum]MCF2166170.1 hypothetical protein [Halobacterium salinarum]MCF2167653.1 hypothetical protein [Halobacterium salinarum]MCF2207559.1 hypothetical protein [Halobacterium salinarum]